MMQVTPTLYARSGEISIAYQVMGNGPLDVIMTPGFVSHLELSTGIGGRLVDRE